MYCYYSQLSVTVINFGSAQGSQKTILKKTRKAVGMKGQTVMLNGNVQWRGVRGEMKSITSFYGERGKNVELFGFSILQYSSMLSKTQMCNIPLGLATGVGPA